MNHKTAALLALLCIVIFSCNKGSTLSAREQQIVAEQTAVLLPNEIMEQEGIRFVLNYDQTSAKLALKLYKGTGTSLTPVSLQQEQPYVNYAVLTDSLEENSEFTIQVDYASVSKPGSFELTVIGFTNLNLSKRFTVSNLGFTPAGQGTFKSIIRLKKGISRYAFYSYP